MKKNLTGWMHIFTKNFLNNIKENVPVINLHHSLRNMFPLTINCPPFKDHIDMQTNLNSSIQNPRNVPAMTILHPINVALATKRILNL